MYEKLYYVSMYYLIFLVLSNNVRKFNDNIQIKKISSITLLEELLIKIL